MGFAKFQFNFKSEEDLLEVLSNASYHYDSWMVSVERWKPVIASSYPLDITFWVTVRDLSFHYWASETIGIVGKALGHVEEVDEDFGSVRVTFNGFSLLKLKTIVLFDNGEEGKMSLVYEKLINYSHNCLNLSHLVEECFELVVQKA